MAQTEKSLPAMQETQVWSLVWEDPLEKEMATHSCILAWRIPWIEEAGGLLSMGLQRLEHDWVTNTHTHTHTHTGALAAIARQGKLETNILHLTNQHYQLPLRFLVKAPTNGFSKAQNQMQSLTDAGRHWENRGKRTGESLWPMIVWAGHLYRSWRL